MYQLVYYWKETKGKKVVEREYHSEEFRLRKNALHYLLEIVQSDYREEGYATEPSVGGLFCYKSFKNNKGDRVYTEILIKVMKVIKR